MITKRSFVHSPAARRSPTQQKWVQITKLSVFQDWRKRNSQIPHKFCEIFITGPVLLLRKMGLSWPLFVSYPNPTALIRGGSKNWLKSSIVPLQVEGGACGLQRAMLPNWSSIHVAPTSLLQHLPTSYGIIYLIFLKQCTFLLPKLIKEFLSK